MEIEFNFRNFEVPVDKLPVTINHPFSRGFAFGATIGVAIFVLIPPLTVAISILAGNFQILHTIVGLVVFPIIGLAVGYFSLPDLYKSSSIIIDRDAVNCKEKNPLGENTWREPLKNYKGVLSRSEMRSTKSQVGGSSTYVAYTLVLQHARLERCQYLYIALDEKELREKWKSYARELNLPALIEDKIGGIEKRDPEDLDKSIKELVQDQKIKLTFDTKELPPPGIIVKNDGGKLLIAFKGVREVINWGVGLLGITSIALFYGLINGILWLILVSGIILLIFAFSIYTAFVGKCQRVKISKDDLLFQTVTPWGEAGESKSFKIAEIESVLVENFDEQMPVKVLSINTKDNKKEKVGYNLPEEELIWLKNLIIYALSR
ncbi:hypothetical protein ACFL35_15280 [Candidatus Riflebacteria bacterium]